VRNDNILSRVLISFIVGIVTFIVAFIVFAVISALLPGVQLNSSFLATVLGILAGLFYFFTGRRAL
jgi:uncharacterized membrane protein